jgi:hypothetical protein
MEVLQQPVLHVEARVKSNSDGIIVRTDLVLHSLYFSATCRGSKQSVITDQGSDHTVVDRQFCCPISGTGDKILRYV